MARSSSDALSLSKCRLRSNRIETTTLYDYKGRRVDCEAIVSRRQH